MPAAEDDLGRIVEQVLGPAWPRERRRASTRLVRSTLLRAAGGVLGFWSLAAALGVLGMPIPWVFYPGIAVLTAAAALLDARDPDHLRDHPQTPGSRSAS
jgi:hypothetical protein